MYPKSSKTLYVYFKVVEIIIVYMFVTASTYKPIKGPSLFYGNNYFRNQIY